MFKCIHCNLTLSALLSDEFECELTSSCFIYDGHNKVLLSRIDFIPGVEGQLIKCQGLLENF